MLFILRSLICWSTVLWCTYGLQVHLQETSEKLEPFLEKQIFKHHPHLPSDYRLLRGQPYRVERSVEGNEDASPNTLSISLPVSGTDLQFTLNKVNIAADGLTMKIHAEGDEKETELEVPLDCFYSGGEDDGWVVISTCTGVNGVVSHNGMAYQVEQINNADDRLMRHRRHISEPLFIIYPVKSQVSEKLDLFPVGDLPSPISSLSSSLRQPSLAYDSLSIPMEEERGGGGGDEGRHRVKRRISKGPYTVELAVFVDRALYSYIKERYPNSDQNTKTVEIVMTLVNAVHRLYSDPSLGNEKVAMLVRRVEVLPSDEPSHAKGNIYKYLKNFCQWQKNKNPEAEKDHWDHALLLSGHDLWNDNPSKNSTVGLAYVGGMCSNSYSCTVNEATTFAAAYIIAHEMGHNFDMKHDGSLEAFSCSANKYIMSPVMASGATKWSTCSKSALSYFLQKRGDCLMESETSNSGVGDKGHEGQVPGKRFDADEQCHYMYGKEWKHFHTQDHPFNNVCREIWCRNGRLLKTPTASALEGTPCGNNKVCKRSKCTKQSKSKNKNVKVKGKNKDIKKIDKKRSNKKDKTASKNKKGKENNNNAKDTKKNDKKKKNKEKDRIKETELKAPKKGNQKKQKKKVTNNKKSKAKDKKKASKATKNKNNKGGVVKIKKKKKLSRGKDDSTSVKTKTKINKKRKKPKKIRREETATHYVIKERKNYVKGKGWKIKIMRIKKTRSMLGILNKKPKKDKQKKKQKRRRIRKCKKQYLSKCEERQKKNKEK